MTPRERAVKLGEALANAPAGLTIHQLAADLGESLYLVRGAVKGLRDLLADTDTLYVTAEPQGQGEPWLYRLIHAPHGIDRNAPEGRWILNRLGDAETRIGTMLGLARAAERATKGNTTEGRKARVLARGLTRLVEDLAEVEGKL